MLNCLRGCICQVAERQGKYIAKALNSLEPAKGRATNVVEKLGPEFEPFVYRHLGSMATIGRYKALVDLRENKVRIRCFAFSNLRKYFAEQCQ